MLRSYLHGALGTQVAPKHYQKQELAVRLQSPYQWQMMPKCALHTHRQLCFLQ